MSTGTSKKIINLSRHSFTNSSGQNEKKGRRFSNINTQAVIYNNEQLQQLYTGLYLEENLHNVGTYRWLSDSGSHKYEGKLFLNHLHGYGKLLYPDDALFEGLFYFNKKLGPGVVTYDNQKQDVGVWNGNYLIRLCDKFSISDYYKENIPKLSGLIESKLYLLQFKHLVPISDKYKDAAKDVLTKLGASNKVLANKNVLYSKLVRNPKSSFVNGEKLYKNFFTYEDELHTTIDVVDHFDEDGKPVIIKLDVCNLVAWNNEEVNTIILKHAFLNRHHEKLLSFKIKDILGAKNRGNFLPPGPIEKKSQELIFACRASDPTPVRRLITEYDLYPDVADCRGNNTVTYATLANRTSVIKVLSEFGANLNSFNDDCVTPLIFAILQYIAIKYDITCNLWESAFIYAKTENDLPPCNQQWPKDSVTSLSKQSYESSPESVDNLSATSKVSISQINAEVFLNDEKVMERRYSLTSLLQEYVFSLDCSHTKRVPNIRKTIIDSDVKYGKSQDMTNLRYQLFKIEEMKKINQTISTLLLCGANPNIGEVPFCPIITSIFSRSKDLIQMLIGFNASVKAKTCDYLGKLGPLHVIGSLNPCLEQLEMAYTFLENGAYVDDLSNKIHWLEEQTVLLADKAPQDCLEKTPLHLVCMRFDFNDDTSNYLMKLALMFVQYGANLNLKYLGHSPLTLTMMRGNTELMENLLETGLVDPNEGLGYDMGVPLTVCVLNRYSRLLHNGMAKQLYSILMQFNANPLNDVPNFDGNAIEFYYCEQNLLHASKRYSLNKVSNGSILLNCAKTTLLKHIESKVVRTLYMFKIIYDLDSLLYQTIVKYLNYKRTIAILQILINHNEIIENEINIRKLLHFVDKKESTQKEKIVKTYEKCVKFHFDNFIPEIDPDDLKYKVCFECFRKTKQLLLLCPKCEMVYFCSQECNLRNSKNPDSGHPCKGTFYEDEKKMLQSNKKRYTKMETLLRKSTKIQNLLLFANIDIEEFGKMTPKNKKHSIVKMKKKLEKRRLSEINKAESSDEKTIAGKEKDQKGKKVNATSTTGEKKQKSKDDKPEKSTQKPNAEKLGKSSPSGTDAKFKKKLSSGDGIKFKNESPSGTDVKLEKSWPDGKDINMDKSSRGGDDKKSDKSSVVDEEDKITEENLEEGALKKAEHNRMKSVQKLEAKYQRSSTLDNNAMDKPTTKDVQISKKRKGSGKKKDTKTAFPIRDSGNDAKGDKTKKLKGRNKSEYSTDTEKESSPKKKKQLKTAKQKDGSISSRSTDSDKDKQKKMKKKASKAGSSAREKSRSKPSTITDFGEDVYNKINLNLKQKVLKGASSIKHGLQVFIGSKKPEIDMEKRNMYLTLRAQMLERDRELNAGKIVTVPCVAEKLRMDKNCTERMLQLARKKIPNLPIDYEELDVKFWQIFSPYCIFQNGQLYYNFNEENNNVYYKITYSSM